MSKKVLVLGEVREGSLRNVSFEAIAAGKKIAAGGEVVGVLDIDSPLKARFTQEDAQGLKKFVNILEKYL